MFKFTIKAGVALGAIYFASEQGLWKDSSTSTKLYGKICSAASPYLDQAKKQLPVQIPDLPKTNQVSYLMKQSWNKGVSFTCMFLANLPENLSNWTRSGVELAMSNEEVKKLYSSIVPFSIAEHSEKK